MDQQSPQQNSDITINKKNRRQVKYMNQDEQIQEDDQINAIIKIDQQTQEDQKGQIEQDNTENNKNQQLSQQNKLLNEGKYLNQNIQFEATKQVQESDEYHTNIQTDQQLKEENNQKDEYHLQQYQTTQEKTFIKINETKEIKAYIKQEILEFKEQIKRLNEKSYYIIAFIDNCFEGFVLQAYDANNKRDVAIKISQNNQDQVDQYSKIQERIYNYEFIIQRYKQFKIGNFFIEVLQYCPTNLKKEIANGSLKIQEIVNIMLSLIIGFAELHINGATHNDIKPQNILLTSDKRVKIINFEGSLYPSEHPKNSSHISPLLFTELFAPPEQLKGKIKPKYADRVDIFSLGKTFYCLLGIDLRQNVQDQLDKITDPKKKHLANFIKYNMLNEKAKLRKKSIQLLSMLHNYMIELVDFDQFIKMFTSKINEITEQEYENQQKKQKSQRYLAYLYCLRGQIKKDLQDINECIKICENIQGFKDQQDFFYFKLIQGDLLSQKIEKKGQEILLDLKQRFQQDETDPFYSDILFTLSISYIHFEQNEQAEKELLQLKKIREKLYCQQNTKIEDQMKHPEIAKVLNQLGIVFQKNGKKEQAIKTCFQSLEISKQIFQEQSLEVADCHISLGDCYFQLALLEDSIYNFQKAKEIKKIFFKGKHTQVAICYQKLAKAYSKQGDKNILSFKYEQKGLEMLENIFEGKNDSNLANSYNSMAIGLSTQGKYKEALKYSYKAHRMNEQIFGAKNNPMVIDSKFNTAGLYCRLGEYTKALQLLEEVLQLRKNNYADQNHSKISQALYWIGICYSNLGKTENELKAHHDALILRENACKIKLESLLSVKNSQENQEESKTQNQNKQEENLNSTQEAQIYEKSDSSQLELNLGYDSSHAQTIGTGTIDSLKKVSDALKSDYYDISLSCHSYAGSLSRKLEYEKSYLYDDLGYQFRKTLNQPLKIADSLNSMAITLFLQGKTEESKIKMNEALDKRIKALNEQQDHVIIAESLFNLSIINFIEGKYQESLKQNSQAWDYQKKQYGEDGHPYMIYCAFLLAIQYYQQNNVQKSDEQYKIAQNMMKNFAKVDAFESYDEALQNVKEGKLEEAKQKLKILMTVRQAISP
ncbi:hypothetical protein ABPG72_013629 [Tetrahymena utriculariae]